MMDLVGFLSARLDEDEALARQAAQVAGPDWTWRTEVPEGCDYPTDYITNLRGTLLLDTMGGIEGDAPHVARHDPARVLREVEAKRRIIAACAETLQGEESHDYVTDGGSGEEYELARFTLRQLAAAWSDHPDCRPEWRP